LYQAHLPATQPQPVTFVGEVHSQVLMPPPSAGL
jgi:hypothetical protein